MQKVRLKSVKSKYVNMSKNSFVRRAERCVSQCDVVMLFAPVVRWFELIKNNKDMMTNLQSSAFVARTTQLLSSVARLRLLLVMLLTLTVSANAWAETITKEISSFSTTSGTFGDVTYTAYKGGGTSNPAVNSNAIRLYQNSSGNTGGYIVLSVPDGYTITSATIESTMATTTGYYIDSNPGNNTPAKANFEVSNKSLSANTAYTVSGLSTQYITFACFGTSSSSRLYVSYLSVTYQSAAAQTYNVTLSRNGVTETINDVEEGTALDDIDGTGDQGGCSPDWEFEGWSKTQRPAQNNTAVMDLVTTVDGAGPYYAVYSHTAEGGGGSTTVEMSSFSAVSGNVNNDANVSYEAAKGTAGTAPAVYSNVLRIYQSGGTLTITGNNEKKLTSITIGSSMATSVSYKIDGGTESSNQSIAANGKFTLSEIEASSVLFTCKGTDKNSRLYLNYLSVTYSGGNTVYYTTSPSCTTETAVYLILKIGIFQKAIFGVSSGYLQVLLCRSFAYHSITNSHIKPPPTPILIKRHTIMYGVVTRW